MVPPFDIHEKYRFSAFVLYHTPLPQQKSGPFSPLLLPCLIFNKKLSVSEPHEGARLFFLPDLLCQTHGLRMTGKEENLLLFPQIHQETQGLFLPSFIKPDKNIIENDRQRLHLPAKGQRHGQTQCQIYLISRAG